MPRSDRDREAPFAVALTGCFLLVALGGVLHHEMWRDELQAWLLARDSASIPELLGAMRSEGHPAAWHLVLFALTRFDSDPASMQLLHACLASASVYLLARHAPFDRMQRCLLAFGYFNVYEYAVISRGYALGVLLVFLFCALHAARDGTAGVEDRASGIARALVLAALANTSVYGLFISVALSVSLVRPRPTLRSTLRPTVPSLAGCTGAAVLLAGWALCYVQVGRVDRGGALGTGGTDGAADAAGPLDLAVRLLSALSHVWRSYLPLPAIGSDDPWNTNFLMDLEPFSPGAAGDVLKGFAALASAGLVALSWTLLRHRPRWSTAYLVGTALTLAFGFAYFDGTTRHHGHLFVLLVACLWLARAQDDACRPRGAASPHGGRAPALAVRRRQDRFLYVLLAFHVGAGIHLHAIDWARPFSGGRDAAAFIERRGLDALPIVGYRDRETSTLSAYLGRALYYPNRGRFGSYWTTPADADWPEVHGAIRDFVLAAGGPVVLVLTEPVAGGIPGTALEKLAYRGGDLVREESFHIYLAVAADLSRSTPP